MCRGGFEFSHYTCLCFLLDHTRLSSCQHAKPKIKIKPCSFPPWADETIVKLNSCSMICQIWIKHQRRGEKIPKTPYTLFDWRYTFNRSGQNPWNSNCKRDQLQTMSMFLYSNASKSQQRALCSCPHMLLAIWYLQHAQMLCCSCM